MDLYFHAINNIKEFIAYRFGTPYTKAIDPKDLKNNGYIQLSVKDNTVIILILYNEGKYRTVNADTKKLIKDSIKKTTKELIIIIDSELEETPSIDDVDDVWVQIRKLSVFYLNIPQNKQIPKHLKEDNQQELKEMLNSWYLDTKSIPRINSNDPPVVWLGGKHGDIITIERPSVSVGSQKIYRLVN